MVPAATPVTTPALLTVATEAEPELQVPKETVSDIVAVKPAHTDVAPEIVPVTIPEDTVIVWVA